MISCPSGPKEYRAVALTSRTTMWRDSTSFLWLAHWSHPVQVQTCGRVYTQSRESHVFWLLQHHQSGSSRWKTHSDAGGWLSSVHLQQCVSDSVVKNTGALQEIIISPYLFTLYTTQFSYCRKTCHLQKFSDDSAVVGGRVQGCGGQLCCVMQAEPSAV